MPSFEFVCNQCQCQWIVADCQDKLDASCVLCVECNGNKVELLGFSQFDDANVLDLARKLCDLEERVDALERFYNDEDDRKFDDVDC